MYAKAKTLGLFSFLLFLAFNLIGCVAEPRRHRMRVVQQREPAPVFDVIVYPNNGQTESQTDRDRYECHLWAVQQTHFDPSLAAANETPQVRVIAPPPGATTAAGAVTGAVIGAAVSNPHHAAGGAIVGALAGAIIGSAADEARQERVEESERELSRRSAVRQRPAQDYRRALSACLEGRGYTIK